MRLGAASGSSPANRPAYLLGFGVSMMSSRSPPYSILSLRRARLAATKPRGSRYTDTELGLTVPNSYYEFKMTNPAKRERAAMDVLELLPYRWALGPTSYDPGIGRWSYTARRPHPGRGKMPETITGTGEDELAAMIDLAIRLDERRRDDRRAEIERRGACVLSGG